MRRFRIPHRFLLPALLALASCAAPEPTQTDRGDQYGYRDGYPEIRVSVVGTFNSDLQPSLSIQIDLVKGSFVYQKGEDGAFHASAAVDIQAIRKVGEDRWNHTVPTTTIDFRDEDERIAFSTDVHHLRTDVEVRPGEYEILISVMDGSSRNRTTRRVLADVPDPVAPVVGLTGVQLYGVFFGEPETLEPITTYDVQNRFDALEFRWFVTLPPRADSARVDIRVQTFEADTSHAREMAGIPVSPGSLAYKGIEYSEPVTIREVNRWAVQRYRPLEMRYRLDGSLVGNYRLEVRIPQDEGEPVLKAREFSIKTSHYPSVRTIREFAEPLAYLMTRREYENLMKITDPDSLKREIDRFWLSGTRNKSLARQVIERYYTRVEEANKQFGSFKEGWRTDMGMVYVLMGPPWYVENTLDTSIWFYTYNRTDLRYVFEFYRPRIADQYFPFQHYVLQRQRYFHSLEYERIQDWRSGAILNER